MREMDADAKALMDVLVTVSPQPARDTVAHEYRATQAGLLAAREVAALPIARVETFSVPGEGGPVRVRLYRDGDDSAPRAALLYIHGGGFVACSIDSHDHYCRRLAQETGLVVVSIDYRLAPEHPYPAGFEDCRDVLRWATGEGGASCGIDAGRVAVGGDSAGAALAAALCLWARDTGGPDIAHQLLIYPVIDNDFATASYRENAEGWFLTTEAMRWFWRQYLGHETAAAEPYAAPGRATDVSGLPPATIVTATFDPLHDEGVDYGRRLEAAGVPVAHRDYAAFHGFAGLEMIASANESRGFIVDRLRTALGAG